MTTFCVEQRAPLQCCINRTAPKLIVSAKAQSKNSTIFGLPDDVILLIISFVDVRDILSLRKTSKRFYSMTKLRWVWHDAMKRHIIDRGLPVPAADKDIQKFSAEHLEARAVHAARFHENWCSPKPKARQRIEFQADTILCNENPELHKTTVSNVSFLSGQNGEFLVTAVERVITCWEVPLDGSGTYRVADWVCSKKVEQLIVNEDPKSEAVVTCVSANRAVDSEVEVCALALDKFHGCFKLLARLRGERHSVMPLHVMHGDYVVFGDPLAVWFYTEPVEVRSMAKAHTVPLFAFQSDKVLTVKIINRYIVIVGEVSIRIDYTPSWKNKRTMYAAGWGACVHFDCSAVEAAVVVRDACAIHDEKQEWSTEPVTILLRCGGDDVDTLQQVDLLPLSKAMLELREERRQKDGRLQPPFQFPPQWANAVVVAPSCRDLFVSPSGKGFWMQTRNVTSRHAVHPARCLVGFHITPAASKQTSPVTKGHPDGAKGQALSTEPMRGNELHVSSDVLYSRRCDMSEIIWKRYSIISAALEDTVGRIAIGDRMGRVEVLDFA
ncbi:uncharacterized protein LAESUDRAFT_741181 [Laetiporus sulphureus 93-53]|uniref:F-box domain-containing protein n=1 Tax=Laetiporus sulphureus 93-53 TaxID=1314785 RepID=A0A165GSX2_9APHY|nr:uncharacterized protein LAESUDRAFT_741181 [Laetiporus sulphureus 93-53]KZT10767.1 hypothetical protein LAESUDRAFT_741181 [Laetiporus sulphureus 93-53]